MRFASVDCIEGDFKGGASMRATLVWILILAAPAGFAEPSQREKSLALFSKAAKVFQHPRCLNCHPGAGNPTQGADLHPHIMNVQRGPDDHGALGMKCAACHGDKNNSNSDVPGAPKWGLAPASMAWQGLSEHELCLALKDPVKNHGMNLQRFIKHNAEDKLVAWGWNPGAGREPVPYTQKEFGEIIAQWVGTGAECP
jgi:cytochrome c553